MILRNLGTRLKPSSATRVLMLTEKAGTTKRIRGRAGQEQRQRVMEAHHYLCVKCSEIGVTRAAVQVDHRVPLEQGGSNDDSNLDPLCTPHHAAKTAAEAAQRAGGGSKP